MDEFKMCVLLLEFCTPYTRQFLKIGTLILRLETLNRISGATRNFDPKLYIVIMHQQSTKSKYRFVFIRCCLSY